MPWIRGAGLALQLLPAGGLSSHSSPERDSWTLLAHLHEGQTGSKVLVAGRGRLLCVTLLQGLFPRLHLLQRLSEAHEHTCIILAFTESKKHTHNLHKNCAADTPNRHTVSRRLVHHTNQSAISGKK